MMAVLWLFVILCVLATFAHRLLYLGSDLHNIPGPRPYPLIGSALNFICTAEKVIPMVNGLQERFGRIFLIWFGVIPVVNVTTPSGAEAVLSSKKNIQKGRAYTLLHPWLGQGLLTSDGQRWFSHRRLITPTFHFSILENFLEIFHDQSNILIKSLSAWADSGDPVEIQPFITRCALDVICEAAMGVKTNAQIEAAGQSSVNSTDGTSEYIKSIFRISQLTTDRILNPLIRTSAIFFRTAKGQAYKKHLAVVHGFTKAVIRARKTGGPTGRTEKRPAFLDLLLEARDQNGEPLSDQDIREEVDTFMFEGHDTTAAAMVWVLYLLGKHPQIQNSIYHELKNIFEQGDNQSISLADLSQMKKLERAIKESLRLYPSVPTVVRTITERIEIDGHTIPKGASMILHIYQLHRDPEIFPDPEKFDPDRFLPENCNNRHPYAYVPFSAGPRNCIGQKFALLEEKLILSQLLMAYEVRFLGELDTNKIRSELILRPPVGLKFQLKKRSS